MDVKGILILVLDWYSSGMCFPKTLLANHVRKFHRTLLVMTELATMIAVWKFTPGYQENICLTFLNDEQFNWHICC